MNGRTLLSLIVWEAINFFNRPCEGFFSLPGIYAVFISTALPGDENPLNDRRHGMVEVVD
jgi:hypothetical protein